MTMSELEKLKAGLPYDFDDDEVDAVKQLAVKRCRELNAIPAVPENRPKRLAALKQLLGDDIPDDVEFLPNFNCDNGRNIHVGKKFIANYNVTILDIAPVTFGDYCMVGPNCVIASVNHPTDPAGRRKHIGIAKPVTFGNDVWLGANVTVVPGVHIGNNVIVAAGAVVTKDLPDNCLAGGVPAKVIKTIENNVD